jgi:predicted DsbA family dithiol-disulfide isomerase
MLRDPQETTTMTDKPQKPPLRIDVISDVVCPWCFIGKRRLEKAIALRPDTPVEVHWRPYYLNDWVPLEGMARADYLTAKFGSVERYRQMAVRIREAAAQEGLDYQLDKISRQPNTRDCHRLILWAGRGGKATEMKQRLMDLYFTEGADLSDPEVLVGAAVHCGMDGEAVRERLRSDADIEQIGQEVEAAKRAGIDGVPFFIFGGVLAVSGAQAPEYLAEAMARAEAELERRRAEASQPNASP